jgi:ribosomal protein S18 acetylase RimI-like enzyme
VRDATLRCVPRPDLSRVVIRSLELPDLKVAATIIALCGDGDVEHQLGLLERRLARRTEDDALLVAELDEAVVGVGRVAYFEAADGAPENAAPSGYYLLGVNVDPAHRRRGIGHALTESRLKWIRSRAKVAWFFTDASNEASIRLHEAFGFRRNSSDFWFPTASFGAAGGILFSLALSS